VAKFLLVFRPRARVDGAVDREYSLNMLVEFIHPN
jgi:hypothetical protein